MGEVVVVPKWGSAKQTTGIIGKLIACDNFIRSKVIPPSFGSVVFNFQGGKVSLTGKETSISGGDCDIIIRGDHVTICGSIECAVEMFCSINREIEEIRALD